MILLCLYYAVFNVLTESVCFYNLAVKEKGKNDTNNCFCESKGRGG